MITSKAPTDEQIDSIHQDLCKMQGVAPKVGEDSPWARHRWGPNKTEDPYRRANRDDMRMTLSEEYTHLKAYLVKARHIHTKLTKAINIGRLLLEYLDLSFALCSSCEGKGGQYENHRWEDCGLCGGWGMVTSS